MARHCPRDRVEGLHPEDPAGGGTAQAGRGHPGLLTSYEALRWLTASTMSRPSTQRRPPGSLTVAAEKKLHTAQPSLSRQIRDGLPTRWQRTSWLASRLR